MDAYIPKPPALPTIDRTTGKVTLLRPEDNGQLDGWVYSEEPFAGGVSGTRFNDAQPEDERQADADAFHAKSKQSII